MSHPKQPDKNWVSPITLSKNGMPNVLLGLSEHLVAKDCTTYPVSSQAQTSNVKIILKMKKSESAIVESQLSDKKKILDVKSKICKKDSQTQKSSPISRQVLTLKEKVSEPFWSRRAKDLSQKLWLPTEIDYVGSHSNSLNGSFNSMESNSWFSIKQWKNMDPIQPTMNLSKTSLPSLMYSIVESMVKEDIKITQNRTIKLKKSNKPVANLCRRIRLFPNQETKEKLKSWFGCVRKTYNLALSSIKEQKSKINLVDLRKEFTNNSKIQNDGLYEYLLETPKHVRDGAIADLVNAFKSNFTKQKQHPDFQFTINYRSKKQEQSILIESDSGVQLDVQNHQIKMYPTFLNNPIDYYIRSKDKKKFVPDIQYDCRLIRDTSGKFYLNIPCHVVPCDNQTGNNHVMNEWVSLDPGVRTFQTMYSPETGTAYKIGQGDISRIYRLCLQLDRLISQQEKGFEEKVKGHTNHRTIKKQIEKLRKKIKHVIDEVHWKTIHFLLSHFSNIIIPNFKVQEMVNRTTRKINKKVVRQMINWRHYTFRQRLISSANRMGKKVYVVGEEYSSKTCGSCLKIDDHLGGKKVYKCPQCHVHIDRDVNGARNIFMMNVRESC